MPMAAVLLIAAVAVLGSGGRSPHSDPNAESQGPAVAALSVEPRVGEWCSPVGCEFHVELSGPGGPWQGRLDHAELGVLTGITPRLPAQLSPGTYSLRAEIHVFGDAIYPGETGPRDLGTTATCSADFTVIPETRTVASTLGFWLDRCSAGAVAIGDPASAATLNLESGIDGDCGEFGCEYRARLSGPGGSWESVIRSPNPPDQIAPGPDLPPVLAPGTYVLEASSHLMSDEAFPGVGHRQEVSVAATCSSEFVVAADTGSVAATVTYDAERCSVSVETTVRASDPSAAPPEATPDGSPAAPPQVICEPNPTNQPGLQCAAAIDAALATLGVDHPPIEKLHFYHSCWSTEGSIVDCAVQLMGIVEITFVDGTEMIVFGVFGFPGDTTVELLQPSTGITNPDITCFLSEPVTICRQYIDAALSALGPVHSPIKEIVVHRICLAPYPEPTHPCGAPIVQVTFAAQRGSEPAEFTVSFLITPGPDGPLASMLGTGPSQVPIE
jgi:hypothetical protein